MCESWVILYNSYQKTSWFFKNIVESCSKILNNQIAYPLFKGYTIKAESNPINPPKGYR